MANMFYGRIEMFDVSFDDSFLICGTAGHIEIYNLDE